MNYLAALLTSQKKNKKIDLQYEKFYDIVSKNMNKNGQHMQFSRDTFINCMSQNPYSVDIADIADNDPDNRTFLDIMYFSFTNRLPEKTEYSFWNESINKDSAYEFRKKVIRHIVENTQPDSDLKYIKKINNNIV